MGISPDALLARLKAKPKSVRDIPRKHRNAARKARQARYLAKSTCFQCSTVFRSPKYKAAHVKSGHQLWAGRNARRTAATAAAKR